MIQNQADRREADERAAERRAHMQAATEGGEPVAPMRADDHSPGEPAIETPIEARQGYLGRPVLTILLAGLALPLVAWVLTAMFAG